jgi:hypothetical protein
LNRLVLSVARIMLYMNANSTGECSWR